MGFMLSDGKRYDMPAVFGPSPVPDKTFIADAHAIVLTYPSSSDAVAALMPRHFSVPDAVTVSVSYVSYQDVDYLGGQSYNEIVVSVSARHNHDGQVIAANFAPVLWVNKVGALISGREYMGLGKLLGVIPDADVTGADAAFACYEDDALLLRGAATTLRKLELSAVERLNAKAAEVQTFGWKYIAAPGGGADLDYPVLNVMRWNYRAAWTGEGWVDFQTPDRKAAPFSSAAISALAALPVAGPIRAFRGTGSAIIDRTATRRLGAM